MSSRKENVIKHPVSYSKLIFLEIHKQFQKDLCKLRLATAKTYLGLLGDGLAPMAYAQGGQIRLTANVSCESIKFFSMKESVPFSK